MYNIYTSYKGFSVFINPSKTYGKYKVDILISGIYKEQDLDYLPSPTNNMRPNRIVADVLGFVLDKNFAQNNFTDEEVLDFVNSNDAEILTLMVIDYEENVSNALEEFINWSPAGYI